MGDTPLHLCVKNGHPECMRMLFTHFPDPYLCNESEMTALGVGMQSKLLRSRENGQLYEYMMKVYRPKTADLIFYCLQRLGALPCSKICNFLMGYDVHMREF
eukprot:CAMPEP_0118666260 /NCGR_PEP_ID=MMETSP0785-20121206/19114_1 /TAXON_ID=91992 /ORGANISM="Bolidomonas pacifica, Strain CCMP 1866" /LENGTH=101 /DNA_ID=CAMNT_0006560547 /DNA_START=1 /DNA_END=303 /DNA_ORIENTATION=-